MDDLLQEDFNYVPFLRPLNIVMHPLYVEKIWYYGYESINLYVNDPLSVVLGEWNLLPFIGIITIADHHLHHHVPSVTAWLGLSPCYHQRPRQDVL